MKCFTCAKVKDLKTCARCREVLKIDLVEIVLGLDPIYLSENNRNKSGRPSKLTATEQHDIRYAHRMGDSLGKLADQYKVSRATIFNIVHK